MAWIHIIVYISNLRTLLASTGSFIIFFLQNAHTRPFSSFMSFEKLLETEHKTPSPDIWIFTSYRALYFKENQLSCTRIHYFNIVSLILAGSYFPRILPMMHFAFHNWL